MGARAVARRDALRWALLDACEGIVSQPLYAKCWFRRSQALDGLGDHKVASGCAQLAQRLHAHDESACAEATLRGEEVARWLTNQAPRLPGATSQ